MAIVTTHAHVLQDDRIALRPLTDADLPALYRWNADPEVPYWTEGDENPEPMTPEDVDGMYEMISRDALCFAIEVEGEMIGDCWLQKMNLPQVRALYPPGTDVRRIDVTIGDKRWGEKAWARACCGCCWSLRSTTRAWTCCTASARITMSARAGCGSGRDLRSLIGSRMGREASCTGD